MQAKIVLVRDSANNKRTKTEWWNVDDNDGNFYSPGTFPPNIRDPKLPRTTKNVLNEINQDLEG